MINCFSVHASHISIHTHNFYELIDRLLINPVVCRLFFLHCLLPSWSIVQSPTHICSKKNSGTLFFVLAQFFFVVLSFFVNSIWQRRKKQQKRVCFAWQNWAKKNSCWPRIQSTKFCRCMIWMQHTHTERERERYMIFFEGHCDGC